MPFPNPEEPGALDLALADAGRLGADLVIASDPDGDRLAVAVPRPGPSVLAERADPAQAGDWQVLTGDQVGALLGAYLLDTGPAQTGTRLVASTVVSSTLLAKIAAAADVRYAETLTGFKWIVRAADGVSGARFVFGYEEALGYAVGNVVRDKDGIGAALAVLGLATAARADSRSVLDSYDDLETAHGVHLTAQLTARTSDPGRIVAKLRADPPTRIGGQPVTSVIDLLANPVPADVLTFWLDGGRVVIRPSGTEPKIKCYIETVEPLAGRPLAAARTVAAARLAPLRTELAALLSGI